MAADDASDLRDRETLQELLSSATGVHHFRLESLEKRVDGLEGDVKKLLVDTTEIKAKMGGLATASDVYKWFAVALVLNFVGLVGHLLIRTLSP